MDDRRDRVEEGERGLAAEPPDGLGERFRGQRAGGDDDAVPVGRSVADLFAADLDQRLAFERFTNGGGKPVAVDCERAAGGQLVLVRRAHDQRGQPSHLRVQKADGARLRIVGAERVGTHQLRKSGGLVHRGRADRPHFVQHRGHAAARDLPGRLRASEAAADHVNGPQ